MARIRYLKPEFFSDEDLAELPFQARLAFAGLWCFADKEGRLEDRPKYLKAMIFPYDSVDMGKELSLLSQGKHGNGFPFIQRYKIEGKEYIQILSWNKHQSPHHTEKESIFPPAPPFKEKEKEKEKCSSPILPLNNYSKTVKEPLKEIYGEFLNVKLTIDEYNKLVTRFGEKITKDQIENLSRYQASKGKKYLNHYATILAWEKKNPSLQKSESKKEIPSGIPESVNEMVKEMKKQGWKV